MAITIVPKELREPLGEPGAKALVTFVDTALESNKNGTLQIVEERFTRRLAEENGKLRAEIAQENGKLRAEIAQENGKLRAEIAQENGKLRAEMHEALAKQHVDLVTRMANLETKVGDEIKKLREEIANLKVLIAETKSSMLRWMFLFWITQMAAFLAIVWKIIP
jgi:Skp family chaperone for outer membrane proteins